MKAISVECLRFVIVGLILALCATPLIMNKIRPNHFYGIRIAKAFRSKELWYQINHTGGKILAVYGIIMSVMGIALFGISKIWEVDLQLFPIIFYVGLLGLAFIHTLIVCNRIS